MYPRIESGTGIETNFASQLRSIRDAAGEKPRRTVESVAVPADANGTTAGEAATRETDNAMGPRNAYGRRMSVLTGERKVPR